MILIAFWSIVYEKIAYFFQNARVFERNIILIVSLDDIVRYIWKLLGIIQ
jgi:hypothetical protein